MKYAIFISVENSIKVLHGYKNEKSAEKASEKIRNELEDNYTHDSASFTVVVIEDA